MDRHPLMPGIRAAEINRGDWPRTLHDKQLTGFSPLVLGMKQAPEVWRRLAVAGEYRWVEAVEWGDDVGFLVEDGRLSLYGVGGRLYWRAAVAGSLVFWGDLYGDGGGVALLRQGNRLTVVDGGTGAVRWEQVYEPSHVDLRVQVAAVLPAAGGLQAAVFEQYGEWGWLLSFEPDGSVRQVWRRQVIAHDVWPVRADHGCDVAFDLSGERPLVWNVRHHRCQSFDAVSGEAVGCIQDQLDGAYRRNYGPWRIATGANGQRAIVVASEMVQTHVHGIRLLGDGTPELAWQRYYGEVYVVPGVAVEFLGVGDVDGDGAEEIVYNVRDPENGFRSFVRGRDVASGEVKYELADQWCSGWAAGVGAAGRTVLLVHPAPEKATPGQGPLALMGWDGGRLETLAAYDHGGPWGAVAVPGAAGADLLLRVIDGEGTAVARLDGTTLAEVERVTDGPAVAAPVGAWVRVDTSPSGGAAARDANAGVEADGGGAAAGRPMLYLASTLGVCPWPGGAAVPFDLQGGAPATLCAADIAVSGKATLLAHVPGQRLKGWRLDGQDPQLIFDEPFLGETARHSPLCYDLDGDGQLELVVPGATARGELTVRALRGDGTELWQTVLPAARTDDGGKVVAWNAGQFLADGTGARAAVAISVYSLRRTLEGTYLLAGDSGQVCWFRGNYYDGEIIRAYRPVGIPGAFDWDGDGVEEIAWDMYSYMAFLRGDGAMAAIFGGPNVRSADEAVPAIDLYNGFTPVYRYPDDERPHWLVHHGHGRFGLVGPDPLQGIWFEDVGYDTPERVGLVDVDGDGVLEVGYALRHSAVFCCRDLWTGAVKWTLELPAAPVGPVIAADVDGDGKGEFLVDRWCIGTDAGGQGEVRWVSPVGLGWAVIGDFDGDGQGEIACVGAGGIVVLKGGGGAAAADG